MATNPYDKYRPGAAAQPSGGPVFGAPPKPTPPPTPIQIEANDRANRAEQRADRAEARSAQQAAQGSESERTAGFLAGRIVDAVTRLSGAGTRDPEALGPTLGVEAVRGVFGDTPANYITDANRQQVRAAQIDIIDAALTLGTGAAYTAEQLEGYREAYFPKLGDDPATVKSKQEALRALIVNAQVKAGKAAPDIERALSALDALSRPVGEPDNAAGAGADHFEEGYDENGLRIRVTDDSPGTPLSLGPDGKPRISGNDPAYAQFAAGLGDIVEGGLNNTIGLIANPINTNLFRGLGYEGFTSNIGGTAREAIGLPYGNETIGAINQAAASGFGGASLARNLGGLVAPGTARNALLEYGSRPMLDTVTGGSAAFSGEAARQMGAGPVGQAAATLIGGAAPSAIMGARNALPGGRAPPPDFDASVVRAGERQGVPIRQPDAAPSRRGDTAALETTPRGGPVIQQARANDNARIEQRVEEVGGPGSVQEPYPLGQRVQSAGNRYIARTREQAGRLYRRAEEASGGARVMPRRAVAEVDRQIAELEAQGANNNAATIGYLRGLRDDLSKDEGFSISEFQGLRSGASKKIRGDQALTVTDADRRLGMVMREFSGDADDQLPEAASTALRGADQFYAERQDFISGVLRNLLGTRGSPLPAERAAHRLVAMTRGKGDYDRFSRMWGELEPDEQADLAATIAASLGRKANGEFSPAALIKSLDPRTGINPRTARLIFGEDGARALSDLRAIASAKTATATALNNSRTGTVVNRVGGGLKTLLMSALGFQAGGIGGAVAGGMAREVMAKWGEERAARALMNPDFTRWLRNAPDATNPRAINAYFKRLEVQAAKSPILAGDVRALQEALAESFSRSPDRLAAAEQENN